MIKITSVKNRLLNAASLLLSASLLLTAPVSAATATKTATPQPVASNGSASDNGLKVSPVRTDVTVNAGSTQVVQVTVQNVTSAVAAYQVVINDFTAGSDESGQPQIILNADQFAASHSLKKLVGQVPNVTLQPGETKNISVPITVPKGYTAGGYYGAVRFVPASSANAANKNVTLSASVGSLVLVTVPGNIREVVSVASLDARKAVGAHQIDSPRTVFTTSKSINAVVRFQNSGDVQEQPFGKILLENWRGKILASYEVNNETPRGNVLPDSIRKFEQPLSKLGSVGKYKLVGNFGYGSNGQLISATTTFYILPGWAILLFVLIIALILFLIFGLPRVIRRYNRRVVSQSQRRG